MLDKKACVYVIIRKGTNRAYVGKHVLHEKENHDKYFGSGNLIKAAIKKYGKDSFIKNILEICDSEDIAYEQERNFWIPLYVSLGYELYNQAPGGEGFTSEYAKKVSNEYYFSLSDEDRSLLYEKRAAAIRRPEVLKKMSDSQKIAQSKNNPKRTPDFLNQKYAFTQTKDFSNKRKEATLGSNNPMFGRSVYDVWVEKYGIEEADIRIKAQSEKRIETWTEDLRKKTGEVRNATRERQKTLNSYKNLTSAMQKPTSLKRRLNNGTISKEDFEIQYAEAKVNLEKVYVIFKEEEKIKYGDVII
jgi:hypothetical protein